MTRGRFFGALCVVSLATVGNAYADSWRFDSMSERLLLVAGPQESEVSSEAEATRWLVEMTQAVRRTDYAGTYVHIRGDQIDTTRLLHRFTATGEQEELEMLNGDPRSVVRHGDHCQCQWPLRKEIVFGEFPGARSRLSGERFAHPAELAANYRIVNLGASRVAGTACHLVGLVPRDGLRYGYKLCVGEQSHLLLRMSIYNEHGLPIEHDFFTALQSRPITEMATDSAQWPDIPMGSPQSVPPGYKVVEQHSSQPPEALAPDEGWIVSPDLPGYAIKSRVWRQNPVTAHRFEHMVVSDGLSTASVFIEDMPEPKTLDPDAARYGMNIAVRQIGPVRLTVIGDLPMAAVEQICRNTVLAKNSGAERAEQNPLQMPNTEAR